MRRILPKYSIKAYVTPRRECFLFVHVFEGHVRGVILNTWVGRGMSKRNTLP